MLKTRIFLFHPNLRQSRVNRILANEAEKKGVEVRDMYELYPDFKVDASVEQSVLEDTDTIVFQFPMYWYSSPALMKEWLDTVLEYGWAYGSNGHALRGKKVILAITQGASEIDYTEDGRFHVTTETLLKPFEVISYHTGLVFQPPFILSGTLGISDEELQERAKDYVNYLRK